MLDSQVVPVRLTGGVNTKTDVKLVMPGKLTLLENGVFTSPDSIIKRNGYTALSTTLVGSGTALTSGASLSTLDNELLSLSGTELYSYSQSSSAYMDKGAAFPVQVSQSPVIRNTYQQSLPDMAVNGGVVVHAWADSRGGIRATVLDQTTGAQFQSDVVLNASATGSPRCVSILGFIFVIYFDGTASLKCRRLNPQSPSSFDAELTLVNNVSAGSPYFDVAVSGSNAVVAYQTNGSIINVFYLTQNGVVGSTAIGLPNAVTIGEAVTNCFSITVDPTTQRVWVFWHNSVNGLRYSILRSDFTSLLAITTIDVLVSPIILQVTAINAPGVSNLMQVFYEITATNTYDHRTITTTVNSTGTVTTLTLVRRSVGLASRAFQLFGSTFVICAYDTVLQATFFLVRVDGLICAKILSSIAGGLPVNRWLPSVVSLSSTQFAYPAIVKTRFVSQSNTTFTLKGVTAITLDTNAVTRYQARQMGTNLHLTGGFLQIYDGQGLVEHGFHTYPENIVATPAAAAGSMADGSYLYYVVWEWQDSKGQMHKSAPSVALTAVVSGGGGAGKVTLTIPTLRMTAKQGARTAPVAAVYRTKVNVSLTAFKVSSITSPLYNDPTVDTISYVDTQNDSAIGANEILYTSGGALPNITPPACSLIDTAKDRMVLSGMEDGFAWLSSKAYINQTGVAFTESSGQVNPLGGKITAVKIMDDKILFFKASFIFITMGDGPDATGANSTYTVPEMITSDVGCTDPRSAVLMPQGLMFKSNKGIYLLDRSLNVSYVGSDVEAYNGQTVTSATLIEDKNQVRFLTDQGVTLVYDYFYKQWATFTNHQGASALIWLGKYTYLKTNGVAMVETPGRYLDGNLEIRLRICTAFIKMAGVQGYQRVRRAAVLGTFKSSHQLRVSVGYNYELSFSDVFTWNAGAVINTNYFGQGAYYGQDPVYGGATDNVYQFRMHLRRQKCESLRFLFEDVTAGTPGEGYSLQDLSLEVAAKHGLMKLPNNKSIG